MNPFETAAKNTLLFFDDGVPPSHRRDPGLEFIPTAPVALAVGVGVFTAYLATATGRAILAELKRRRRLREKLPASPSLRGSPTPDELEDLGALAPRTLAVRLRLGSRLADLEPTLSARIECRTLRNGQKRIKNRAPGLKGWLSDRRVTLNYSTLVRYKKLAQRLRQLLALDDRLPLEWLLPGDDPGKALPSDLRAQYAAARRRLAGLLRTHRNFSRLSRHVEEKLGIPQLLAVRRARIRAKQDRRAARHLKRIQASHAKYGPPTVRVVTPDRLEATADAFRAFLREKRLPPALDRLRIRALDWLKSAPAATPQRGGTPTRVFHSI